MKTSNFLIFVCCLLVAVFSFSLLSRIGGDGDVITGIIGSINGDSSNDSTDGDSNANGNTNGNGDNSDGSTDGVGSDTSDEYSYVYYDFSEKALSSFDKLTFEYDIEFSGDKLPYIFTQLLFDGADAKVDEHFSFFLSQANTSSSIVDFPYLSSVYDPGVSLPSADTYHISYVLKRQTIKVNLWDLTISINGYGTENTTRPTFFSSIDLSGYTSLYRCKIGFDPAYKDSLKFSTCNITVSEYEQTDDDTGIALKLVSEDTTTRIVDDVIHVGKSPGDSYAYFDLSEYAITSSSKTITIAFDINIVSDYALPNMFFRNEFGCSDGNNTIIEESQLRMTGNDGSSFWVNYNVLDSENYTGTRYNYSDTYSVKYKYTRQSGSDLWDLTIIFGDYGTEDTGYADHFKGIDLSNISFLGRFRIGLLSNSSESCFKVENFGVLVSDSNISNLPTTPPISGSGTITV